MLALAALVRIRVGLNYSHENLVKMIAIYTLAALPFFTGGAVISLAITRLRKQVNIVYAADLIGAAVGLPSAAAAVEPLRRARRRVACCRARRRRGVAVFACQGAGANGGDCGAGRRHPGRAAAAGSAPFDVSNTKGHDDDTVLFASGIRFRASRCTTDRMATGR